MFKAARPAITTFLVGGLVGMLILATVRAVVSEAIALLVLLILAVLWILPTSLSRGRKALKRQLTSKTSRRRAAARKKETHD
jgi:uncharacterized membrane protein YfcA